MMLKWTRRILVFLLLGAIVNVAVAWGCAILHHKGAQQTYFSRGSKPGTRFEWTGIVAPGCEYVTDWRFIEEPGPRGDGGMEAYLVDKWWPGDPRGYEITNEIHHLGCGWPMLALTASLRFDSDVGDTSTRVTGGVRLEPLEQITLGSGVPLIIPLRPLWTGFSVNAITYGLLLGCFVLGRSRLIQHLRRRRGLCPACAYPRGTSPVCTECGEPLPC